MTIIFKYIFLNAKVWIAIIVSLKFIPKGPIDNLPALVQIMGWRWPGDKLLSKSMMAQFIDAYKRHLTSVSQCVDSKQFNRNSMFPKICTRILFCCGYTCIMSSWCIHIFFFRVTSLTLYDCSNANAVTLRDMGKISWHLTTTKHRVWIMCISMA